MILADVVFDLHSNDCLLCENFSAGVGSLFLIFLLFPFLKVCSLCFCWCASFSLISL